MEMSTGVSLLRTAQSSLTGWTIGGSAIEQRLRNSNYFVVRTIKGRNRPQRFHALVEIRQAPHTQVLRLLDELVT